MDSLTQIVLGAAVGEAVLGKKIGNKAMLYGAIAGTIPDLDVFASYFTDTVTALEIHRGFTHSIIFSLVFAPVCGWIVSRYETLSAFKGWTWLFFWAFLTHPILDSYTTWGTQLFWPLDIRLAFKSIFVIDPLYTVPFLVFLILAMFQHRTSNRRRVYNNLGLIISSCYLTFTLLLKWAAYTKFETALKDQSIGYDKIDTRPSPLNTILWNANVETKDSYLLGDYSFFDSQPIAFDRYKKNHELLDRYRTNENVQRMITISEGWYTLIEREDRLYYNELRFGLLSMDKGSQKFVFQYEIVEDSDGNVRFIEQKKDQRDGKKLLLGLWERIKGN
ncbi:MAG: metal-dependent hydrolase [Aquaticitalea sp.]